MASPLSPHGVARALLAALTLALGAAPACGSELSGAPPDALDSADTSQPEPDTSPDVDLSDADAHPDDSTALDTTSPDLADSQPDEVDARDGAETDDTLGPNDVSPDTADVAPLPCQGLPDDAPCDDGNLCTLGDRCSAGRCLPTAALACDDGNPCTDDTCRPAEGCAQLPNLATCDDGDACTLGDRCSAGACRPGAAACDDRNPCTRDACDDGACSHVADDALPCEDASACTSGDFCADGVCLGGLVDGCAQTDVCVASRCAADGLTCRVDFLDGVTCDDGNACTEVDRCQGGLCRSGSTLDCGWDSECGVFRCDPRDGCVLETAFQVGKTCSDNDQCTSGDACDGEGACLPQSEAPCNDNNPCTEDSCSATWGCSYGWVGGPCNDGNICTTNDACQSGQCRGTASACNDQNACTADSCDPLTGCEFLPLTCDDGNPCTTDRCHPDAGCSHEPRAGACEDGLACTVGDRCEAGRCHPGAVACDDGDPCTLDLCDPEEGCTEVPRDPCPVGAVTIEALGLVSPAAAQGPGFGQWVALRNAGNAPFALEGWALVGRACDCEALLTGLDGPLAAGAELFGLRASTPAPSAGELAPGGPTSAAAFDFLIGAPGDAFFIDPRGDRVDLIDATGATIDTYLVE